MRPSPPLILARDGGLKLTILQRNVGPKWLGCMLTAERSQSQHVHLEYHLQQASIFFFANRWISLDQNVSISKRLKYFNAVVSSVACFGSGHRAISNFLPASFPIFCSLHHGNNKYENHLYLTLSIHVLCSDVWSAPATPLVPSLCRHDFVCGLSSADHAPCGDAVGVAGWWDARLLWVGYVKV